jgi:SAM-dependent methyltransferase
MADFARQSGFDVEVATFEAWDAAGRTFDAVIAATAWHWVDPVAGAAKAAQVLRPGGRFATFWNASEAPPAVSEAFAVAYRRVMPDSPFALQPPSAGQPRSAIDGYRTMMTKAADGMREVGGFSDPEQWRFDWEQHYSRGEWLDQLPTTGLLTRLPQEKLTEVLEGVGAAIDGIGGSFTMRWATVVVTATRLPG